MKVAVVIPCYNVAPHIEKVILSIPAHVEWIIAVNDHSTDMTGRILQILRHQLTNLICIDHPENRGVGGAMITGYQHAMELNAGIVVKIDGDGQMDSSNIGVLIQPIVDRKADFTKGNRFRDLRALRAMPFIRRIGNMGLSFLIKAASGYWNIFDPTNGYTAIAVDKLKELNFQKISLRYFFESSLLIELYHANAVIVDVPMKAQYGNEISGLSVTHSFFTFPPKLFTAFCRRIGLKYFLFDFNIASLYILLGIPLFLAGAIYGLINFIEYGSSHTPAPTGTVVIPALLIILGFQLLLSAAEFDVKNYPRKRE
jgi:glycosyltransferase involved in cell wall biosynthesis